SVAWMIPQHEAGSVAHLPCFVQRFLKDILGLQDVGSNPTLSYYSGLTKKPGESRIDYLHLSAGVYVASAGITVARNNTVFVGFGFIKPGARSLVSGKIGGSISAGKMTCEKSGAEVDNFVTGATTGAGAYYGPGGALVYNTAGAALELGLGTPGVSLQPYEYIFPIWNFKGN
ncbi:hypothetical protein ACFFJ4_06135, partial [Xanthomonas dyei]